ncbi:MAG: hypothetical protein JNM80_04050 [Phycisphaerae bacterium]|nr:hypothetical protein [Phycisphaerae bacterium]
MIVAVAWAMMALCVQPPATGDAARMPTAAQDAPAKPESPEGGSGPSVAEVAALERLSPEHPEGYLLAAEDVADAAVGAEGEEARRLRALAQRLYVLAFELDRVKGRPGAVAASAVVGLADPVLEPVASRRTWLLAIAGGISAQYAAADWNLAAEGVPSDEVAYRAATLLGRLRAGEGRDARKMMEDPQVAAVLRRYERAIGTTGMTGALTRLDRYMQNWPCKECRNDRFVLRVSDRGAEVRLCPTCRGNPGPVLSEEELIGQLRFEDSLLSGIHDSWAAQTTVDQAAPLRDPDPEAVAPAYGVDAREAWYRKGKWVARP